MRYFRRTSAYINKYYTIDENNYVKELNVNTGQIRKLSIRVGPHKMISKYKATEISKDEYFKVKYKNIKL
jgi:hypothetical protein